MDEVEVIGGNEGEENLLSSADFSYNIENGDGNEGIKAQNRKKLNPRQRKKAKLLMLSAASIGDVDANTSSIDNLEEAGVLFAGNEKNEVEVELEMTCEKYEDGDSNENLNSKLQHKKLSQRQRKKAKLLKKNSTGETTMSSDGGIKRVHDDLGGGEIRDEGDEGVEVQEDRADHTQFRINKKPNPRQRKKARLLKMNSASTGTGESTADGDNIYNNEQGEGGLFYANNEEEEVWMKLEMSGAKEEVQESVFTANVASSVSVSGSKDGDDEAASAKQLSKKKLNPRQRKKVHQLLALKEEEAGSPSPVGVC